MTVQVDPNEGKRSDFCEYWDDKRAETLEFLGTITSKLMNPEDTYSSVCIADLEHVIKDCGRIINKVAEVSAACTALLTIKLDPAGVAAGKYRTMSDPDFSHHVRQLWKEGMESDGGPMES